MTKKEKMRLTRGGRMECNGGGGTSIMMGFKERAFAPLVAVSLEELVPQDHFYRHLQKVLDLSFVYDLVRESYAVAGRPSIDPVVFFTMQKKTLFFYYSCFTISPFLYLKGYILLCVYFIFLLLYPYQREALHEHTHRVLP